MIRFETSLGDITIEMLEKEAPVTTANFLKYVDDGYFDGTIFHRVIPGFVIQGGGFTEDMTQKRTQPPIKNEADNGLKNSRGNFGYAVFARVTEGMDVVDKIAEVETGRRRGHDDVPVQPVIVRSAKRI